MSNLNEIIRQIYKDLYCPVCGKNYKVGQLSFRGLVGQTLAVETSCSNGHATLFMTTLNNFDQAKQETVSADDCILFHKNIRNFNGDFTTLWKK